MPPLGLLPDTKRALLLLMKREGGVTLEAAGQATGLARPTLREHLAQLERDGLVAREAERQGRGRPRHRYRLAARGEALFPSHDGALLRDLLGFLQAEGEVVLVERFFEAYWAEREREVAERLAGLAADDDAGRLAALAAVLDEQGFMPLVGGGVGRAELRACHCPFRAAVEVTRLPCRLEARLFERLLGRAAERVSYIPDGRPACTYALDAAT